MSTLLRNRFRKTLRSPVQTTGIVDREKAAYLKARLQLQPTLRFELSGIVLVSLPGVSVLVTPLLKAQQHT